MRRAAPSSSWHRSATAGSWRAPWPRRSTSGRCPGARSLEGIADFLAAAHAAAGPRQLRARAARDRRAGRRAAARRAGPHDPRDEPRAAARRRRGRLSRALDGDPRPRAAAGARGAAALRGGAAAERSRRSGGARLRDRRRERGGRRADLLSPRRPAARARAGGGTDRRARHGDARRAARRQLPAAAHRQPRRADPPADACGDAAVEPRPAGRRGEAAAAPPRRVRRRLRPRRRRGRLRRRRARARRPSPTCSPGSSRNRSSAPSSSGAGAAITCSRPCASTRASSSTRRAKAASLAERHARWALAMAEREGGSPRLDREAANLRVGARRPARARPAARRCATAWRCRRSGCAGSTSRRGTGASRESLAAAPERTALRAAGLLAMSAIDYRAGDLACGAGHAQESYEIAGELGDAAGSVARAAAARRDRRRLRRRAEGAARCSSRRARLAATRGIRRLAKPSRSYSLGVARWLLGDLAGAEALLIESAASFRRAGRLHGADPLAAEHRRDALRAIPRGSRGCGSSSRRRCSPFVEISCDTAIGYVLANQATIARVREELGRARELLDEAGERFARAGDERGQADVLVRRAYLELAEGSLDDGARVPRACAAAAPGACATGAASGWRCWPSASSRPSAATTSGPSSRSSEARELFRRAGDRWGLVELAVADGRPGDRARTPRRRRGGAAGSACGRRRDRAPRLDRRHRRDAGGGCAAARRCRARAGAVRAGARALPRRRRRGRRRGDATRVCKASPRIGKGHAKSRRVGLPAQRQQNGGSHECNNRPGPRGGNGAGAARGDPRARPASRATTATQRRAGSGTAPSTSGARR